MLGGARRARKPSPCSIVSGIPDAARRVDAYPHQFSGGQRQRVTIAMALACQPDVLIADEPTTALDVTIQGQILDLIADLVAERGMSMILISHDLGVIAENVQRMMVMYGGTVVESGADEGRVRAACDIPIRRACFALARALVRGRAQGCDHRRHRARACRSALGLHLRRPLRDRRRSLPRGVAGRGGRRRRPWRALHQDGCFDG